MKKTSEEQLVSEVCVFLAEFKHLWPDIDGHIAP